MWALSTCGEPNEIKKNTHPGNITALFGEQASVDWKASGAGVRMEVVVPASATASLRLPLLQTASGTAAAAVVRHNGKVVVTGEAGGGAQASVEARESDGELVLATTLLGGKHTFTVSYV